ncbi:MAG TPA: peptidoglycan DD-metalloendopeptidase family protein [Povalibacter sp.]|nr:peptidoglycan DD-metalloendopeptidase family protein [Povalibacter sp.]
MLTITDTMRLRRTWSTLLLLLILLAAGLATLSWSPTASAGSCTPRNEPRTDPTTGWSWSQSWYCGNDSGAAMYAAPNRNSPPVAYMYSNPSWFVCYKVGAQHEGGNNIWYYSLGDDPVGVWGYMPAVNVYTDTDPWPGMPACPNPPPPAAGTWSDLGGALSSAPNCISWQPNRIDCFAQGASNQLIHRFFWAGSWSGWEDLGGVLTSAPSCTSWARNRIDCFARGTDNSMHHRWWDGSRWNGWENLGGGLASQPNCIARAPNRINCFIQGTDAALWMKDWNGSQWSIWQRLDGVLTSAPVCVARSTSKIDCFVRGSTNHLHHRAWNGSSWAGWIDLGNVLASAPNCVAWSADRIDCFVRTSGNTLQQRRWTTGGGWGNWNALSGTLTAEPGCLGWAAGKLECYSRTSDNRMNRVRGDDSGWTSAENLNGTLASAPSCVQHTPGARGRIDCFVKGSNGHLWQWSETSTRPTYVLPYARDTFGTTLGYLTINHGSPNYWATDLILPEGTRVYSVINGTMVGEDTNGDGTFDRNDDDIGGTCGHGMTIRGDDGLYYLYCHGQYSTDVQLNSRVEVGQLILYSGDTGESGAPHLHLEIQQGHGDYWGKLNKYCAQRFLRSVYNGAPQSPVNFLASGGNCASP